MSEPEFLSWVESYNKEEAELELKREREEAELARKHGKYK